MNTITLMEAVDNFDQQTAYMKTERKDWIKSLNAAYTRFTNTKNVGPRPFLFQDAVIIVSMICRLVKG